MRTYKMTISYDGTRYQGWQRQAMTDNTIQHILEWTIGRMVGYRVQVDGSGRTDSGVHARGQVASVKLSLECRSTSAALAAFSLWNPQYIQAVSK